MPGLNFNDTTDALGNSGLGTNLAPKTVAGQSLTNFGVGRQDSSLGYGGLVLSLQSENISALIRALAENHKIEVLQRPQVTMLDNQPGNVQVGQRVPTISSVSVNALTGQSNAVTFQNVGVLLGITPRISPDGMVVMAVDAEKSALESVDTGIPIYSSPTGQVIRSPIIDSTVAQTTVSAMDGQTIVLAGLITKNKNEQHRSVPWLGDIPVIGNLFRYDTTSNERTELLIILTPHVIHNPAEADAIKRDEAAKMSWCLCDVTKIYGEAGLSQRGGVWGGADVKVVYPDAPDQVLPGMHPRRRPCRRRKARRAEAPRCRIRPIGRSRPRPLRDRSRRRRAIRYRECSPTDRSRAAVNQPIRRSSRRPSCSRPTGSSPRPARRRTRRRRRPCTSSRWARVRTSNSTTVRTENITCTGQAGRGRTTEGDNHHCQEHLHRSMPRC